MLLGQKFTHSSLKDFRQYAELIWLRTSVKHNGKEYCLLGIINMIIVSLCPVTEVTNLYTLGIFQQVWKLK